jgi:hypothetical protein
MNLDLVLLIGAAAVNAKVGSLNLVAAGLLLWIVSVIL